MKSYTDLEQSKKLAEILPIESADMMYHSVETEYGSGAFVAASKVITNGLKNDDFYVDDIPCWSLAALLEVLLYPTLYQQGDGAWGLDAWVEQVKPYSVKNAICEVDACYEMIIKLHEQNLL